MSLTKATVLIADDEPSIRDSLKILLESHYKVFTAANGREAIEKALKEDVDLVLLDIKMPEVDGMEVLTRLKESAPQISIIILTATKTVATAVKAMKLGAYDYITKPFDVDDLLAVISRCLEHKTLVEENIYLKREVEDRWKMVGESRAMQEIARLITEVAGSTATVLILGESGTGKELVARAIHQRGPRAKHLFVAVNCAAIPENLLESELFGHEKGAFTGAFERKLGKFEIAHGGTLLLDEVGSLPLPMQAKLLRTLQEKEIERVGGLKPIPVDVRIISASNTDLKTLVDEHKFREDLYYRLNVIPIKIPPLRERKEDLPLLVNYFLERYNRDLRKKIKGFTPEAHQLLVSHSWPGNVRELQNLIERLLVLEKGDYINSESLPPEISKLPPTVPSLEERERITLKEAVERFETEFIKKAIEKTGGAKSKAAELLGIHRNTLLKLLKKTKKK